MTVASARCRSALSVTIRPKSGQFRVQRRMHRMHDRREHMKDYQVRPDEIAASAWNRGYLTPLELLRLAAWKTGKGLGHLTVNSEHEIESRTKAAIDIIRPWKGRRVVGLTD